MTRPNFGNLWPGEWPHDEREGVGIHLTGFPRDYSLFRAILTQYSCPLDIAWRHSDHIRIHGELKTTVLAHLNFPALAQHLEQVGVALTIIPPKGYKAP